MGRPAALKRVPLHGGLGGLDGEGNRLVALSDRIRSTTARAEVRVVLSKANIVFSGSLTPVVIPLVVLHDGLLVSSHVCSLLVFSIYLQFDASDFCHC